MPFRNPESIYICYGYYLGSLWKEMFQCYEPWLTKTKCSPASVARVASMGLKAAQTFFKNFLPATSNMFSSNLPGKTVIDYAANCPGKTL